MKLLLLAALLALVLGCSGGNGDGTVQAPATSAPGDVSGTFTAPDPASSPAPTSVATPRDLSSVLEYAEACKDRGERTRVYTEMTLTTEEDIERAVEALNDSVEEVDGWNPPDELRDWHEATVLLGAKIVAILRAEDDLMGIRTALHHDTADPITLNILMRHVTPDGATIEEMNEMATEVARLQSELSSETLAILESTSCI